LPAVALLAAVPGRSAGAEPGEPFAANFGVGDAPAQQIVPAGGLVPATGQPAIGQPAIGQPATGTLAVCDPGDVFLPPAAGAAGAAEPALILGAEFLLIRPHFSEAVAFADGRVTPGGFQTSSRELDFNYDPSFRTRLGYRFGGTGQAILFTYWHFDGDVGVAGAPQPGGFSIDPFGNAAGFAVNPQTGLPLPAGDFTATRAEVEMNVFDLDWLVPLVQRGPASVVGTAGVRVAAVDQSYESVVTLGGARFARGDYSADFTGAGPHLGANLGYALDADGRLQAFVKASGALLVGEYNVQSSNTTTFPPLRAAQQESMTRTIPVFESEVGLAWECLPGATVSAGWMFQSWFDLGTSGGTFGGLFSGADDANIMSFDGLILRANYRF
jgi:hypothetical protein